MEEYLAAHSHTPQVVFRTDGNTAIQRLVGIGRTPTHRPRSHI